MPLLLNEQKRFAAVCDSLRELGDALAAGLTTLPSSLDAASLIEELGEVLGEHFHAADRYLEGVATHRADLLPAVVDLKSDHASLHRALQDLRIVVADKVRWPELPGRIGSLLRTLAEHREAEAALTRAAAHPENAPD